jgi:hypothetical protein
MRLIQYDALVEAFVINLGLRFGPTLSKDTAEAWRATFAYLRGFIVASSTKRQGEECYIM